MAEVWPTSDELCEQIRAESDTVLLSFSCGKDSVAAWLQLRRHGFRVVPFYRYLVPGLEFVEADVRYFEEFFSTPIERVADPSFYRWLRNLTFCPPEFAAARERLHLPDVRYHHIDAELRRRHGRNLPMAIGTRAADSPMRTMSMQQTGPRNAERMQFLPVWDWKIADVRRELQAAGVVLPVDYEMFGRTFDGLDFRFLKPIRERFPRDYQRILHWFPLAELEFFRRELAG